MKILFIFTGGTIGSTLSGDTIATDGAKSKLLISAYAQKYGVNFSYDMIEPYTELSENCTGEHIRLLLDAVKSHLNSVYDGIIVTHGTDSLPFSAAAIGYATGLSSLPVCIVSSNYPIEDERANALANLHGAIRFIEGGCGKGAFVVYRNRTESRVRVHRATRVLASKAFSDKVYSAYDCEYGSFDKSFNFDKNEFYREFPDELSPLDGNALQPVCNSVIYLPSVVGLPYPTLNKDVKFVLLGTYHSGTLNTQSADARAFFAQAKQKGVTVFATGTYGGPDYASAKLFDELGIIPVRDVSPVAAYIKLWLLSSVGADCKTALSLPLAGDVVPVN